MYLQQGEVVALPVLSSWAEGFDQMYGESFAVSATYLGHNCVIIPILVKFFEFARMYKSIFRQAVGEIFLIGEHMPWG